MKEQKKNTKNKILKKLFIKLSRLMGFELIDQSNFYVTTQNKDLAENISIPGKKSINIPLGETKITRKVKSLSIIFRSCTKINMLTQNKKRLFDQKKSEYTFRSLNSIIFSLKKAKSIFPKINFDIFVIDHNSNNDDLTQIKKQLINSNFKYSITSLDINEFKNDIKKINEKNEKVTENQISNMCNIHKSLQIAKDKCSDLIYFVEDDYLHNTNAISEMIFAYERISSQLESELVLCPSDYPYLYTKFDSTKILLGSTVHWRKISETLCTFLTSKNLLEKYWEKFISMCKYEHYPFEKPLHDIYEKEYCFSPIPSLSFHCTNVNSIFGLSPNINWKKIWNENENY